MKAPQIVMIALLALGLGTDLTHHGETKTGSSAKYNFLTTCIATAINVAILWWGGFWK